MASRRFPAAPYAAALLAVLAMLFAAGGAAAREYWRLRRPGATVIVDGDRKFAESALARVLLVQGTARRMLGWPGGFQPRPVLAFIVDEQQVNRTFESDPLTASEHTLLTPGLAVVVAPLVSMHRRELEQFQQAYGAMLLRESPTERWPECAHLGFRMVFTAAEYTDRTHLYVGAERVVPYETLMPDKFLADASSPATMLERDRRGYSCYLLDLMLATGDAGLRGGITQLFTALGAGVSLDAAIPESLGGTLPNFASKYQASLPRLPGDLRRLDVRADLTLPDPLVTEAESLPAERVEAMLKTLCAKLEDCRVAGAAAAH